MVVYGSVDSYYVKFMRVGKARYQTKTAVMQKASSFNEFPQILSFIMSHKASGKEVIQ